MPRDVRALVVRAAAVDDRSAYRLFDLRRGGAFPLARSLAAAPRALTLAPHAPLRPGRYVFAATHEGMFGGRDYAYVTVVPPGAAATAIGSTHGARTPAGRRRAAAGRRGARRALFALLLAGRSAAGPPAQKALWAAGFLLFAGRGPARRSRSGTAGRPRSSASTTSAEAC